MDIASACLIGEKCRYDGEARENTEMKKLYFSGKIKPVCPECLGGLPIPRCPSEIVGGDGKDVLGGKAKVYSMDGADLTDAFLKGAAQTLAAAKDCGAKRAYMKSKSPSCGCGMIYDGTFSCRLRQGDGVTSALLKKNGIEVIEI
ncbi:MAG: DUF523 domain-containing protein [Christensenellales bacterium]|jgi:uncharacterized protein YbbK (DUF523 family)